MRGTTRPDSERAPTVEGLSQSDLTVETYQVVAPDGTVREGEVPAFTDDQFRELYRWLLLQRTFDDRMTKLQRRGQLGTYASGRGQEASIVGSGFALDDGDWLFPYGREAGALLLHGLSMRDLVMYWRGIEDASRMEGANVFGVAIAIGSHVPLATGKAWGMQLDGDDTVAFANLGDGATSTGAFHEGLNLAGVLSVPAVFFCQNNQYAISLPFEKQTGADTVAQKALAYGVDGIRVDGNDVLAVYNAVATARRRALDGRPTLVEAVTYRRAAHTTSDDPSRYREQAEVDEWAERDPLDRYRGFLAGRGLLDDVDEERVQAEVDELFDEAVAAADDYPHRDLAEMFVHLYEEPTPELESQLAWYRDFLDTHPEMAEYIHQRERG
ncbi:2-oxo-3-methylvalerate dehydrogenase E1 component subunit alpha [Salinigranum rubrum]|uniref:2-oxo-3-methylvalerate dehydrogenase E1 component subunit alpha n=1 Tax=Salinigranum rubrum TaxID=755307 RepID=A0A2I8VNK1_9EURY|nr:thiamine pyrophosphate-dependent dehydrogenase E1 component subunit alpha [Salinigranum rubrum]AUV82679.1 2-oxo-3-methylvalerate dehydrogenase E1 component subunit alpha [Salinigranum rubrum]